MADEPVEATNSYSRNYFTPRNIIIYAVVGVIVYTAIYFLFLSNKGSAPYQAPTTTTETSQEETTAANSITVAVGEENDSGESGPADLVEEDGETTVSISLDGAPAGVSQPAHIHSGACPTPGEVIYPLNNVVDGISETVLDVNIEKLKSELPLAINVHKSSQEASVYVSCGNLQ